jgi:uncharacterized membrane protein
LLTEFLNFLSVEFTVLLTAALPVIELRGAIPVGISLGLSPLHATFLSFIGSMVPSPLILYAVRPLFKYLRTTRYFKKPVEKLTERTLGNGKAHKVQKYGAWGLFIFVAIPLPGTGVWTGSLIAALLDIRIKWALPAIFFGNMIAAIIIATVSYGLFSIFSG